MKLSTLVVAALVGSLAVVGAQETAKKKVQKSPMATADMSPASDIVTNIAASESHTTFLAALKHSGLAKKLSGEGPFTVFAPTNAAFEVLSPASLDWLMKPEGAEALADVVANHIVKGSLNTWALREKAKANEWGAVKLETLAGTMIAVTLEDEKALVVRSGAETMAEIAAYDLEQSNGFVHVITKVLMPAKKQ